MRKRERTRDCPRLLQLMEITTLVSFSQTCKKKSAPMLFLGHRSMRQIRLYVSLYNDKLTAIISPLTALK